MCSTSKGSSGLSWQSAAYSAYSQVSSRARSTRVSVKKGNRQGERTAPALFRLDARPNSLRPTRDGTPPLRQDVGRGALVLLCYAGALRFFFHNILCYSFCKRLHALLVCDSQPFMSVFLSAEGARGDVELRARASGCDPAS